MVCMSSSYFAFEPRMIVFMIGGRFARRPLSARKSAIACTKGCVFSYSGDASLSRARH